MPKKRKKYPKLPNGFGSIRYMGAGRRRPYAVHPPAERNLQDGTFPRPKALCYVENYMQGMQVLMAWHAGTYTPDTPANVISSFDTSQSDAFVSAILADYGRFKGAEVQKPYLTLKDAFEGMMARKKEGKNGKKPKNVTITGDYTSFNHFEELHERNIYEIQREDYQKILDEDTCGYNLKCKMKSVIAQIYDYMKIQYKLQQDESYGLVIHDEDNTESGVPFTVNEVRKMYELRNNKAIRIFLILCLSGFRINELFNAEVDFEKNCFHGGSKTAAGLNREVPIHHLILPLVRENISLYGKISPYKYRTFMNEIKEALLANDLYYCINKNGKQTHHTPHDTRHTFSMLGTKYKMDLYCKKKIMGHSMNNDITNSVYGHFDIELLRNEIEKITLEDL